jgi:hypothetical protein
MAYNGSTLTAETIRDIVVLDQRRLRVTAVSGATSAAIRDLST